MARVTVEDCIDKVDNRFDLVLLASHRARMISSGGPITIDRDNDKNPVVALREIADQTVSPEDLKEDLIHSLQKYVEVDEPEAEAVPLIAGSGDDVLEGGELGHCCSFPIGLRSLTAADAINLCRQMDEIPGNKPGREPG